MININLREAGIEDIKLYFDWANDPSVRSQAISVETIPWESHVNWFEEKLLSDSVMLIMENQSSEPIGHIRFDLVLDKDEHYLLSFSIDREHRGNGYGKVIVKKGLEYLLSLPLRTNKVTAQVKIDNNPSNKVFEGLSFSFQGTTEINESQLNEYVYFLQR